MVSFQKCSAILSNLSRELQKAVKNLRKDRNIVILPADKGNATVILDQADYAAKMEHLLEDRAYKKVQRNPASRVEAMVSTALKECERKGHITSKKRLTLAHQFSSPPYGEENSMACLRYTRKESPSDQSWQP